jgi:hypothetical protein
LAGLNYNSPFRILSSGVWLSPNILSNFSKS